MNDFLITICIVNYNSSDFIINTLYCLERITKNDYKVIIRDNNSRIKDYLNLKKKIQKYPNVELYRIDNFEFTGSIAHGIAINDLVKRIDTKYGAILDADCTFLYKNWDKVLIKQIDRQYPIIGTQAPPQKPQDFPYVFALFFINDIIQNLGIDFKPTDIRKFKDTGFELREKFFEKGYKGKLLRIKITRTYKSGPFGDKVICAEYYLNGIKEIFASHFGRGSTLGISKYLKGFKKKFYKIPIIGKYFLVRKGKKEMKKWMKICKNIINKQEI